MKLQPESSRRLLLLSVRGSFSSALQALQRILGPSPQLPREDAFQNPSLPTWREAEVSAVLDAGVAIHASHADVFMHCQAEGKEAVEVEVVLRIVDVPNLEVKLETKDGKARSHVNQLARPSAARWLDALDPPVRPGAVTRGVGQQLPDGVRRRGNRVSRTNVQPGT